MLSGFAGDARRLARLGLLDNLVWVRPAMPDLGSWRLAARELVERLGVRMRPLPTFARLRGQWRHLVVDVSQVDMTAPDVVYVGRSWRFGRATFGNHAARTNRDLRGTRQRDDHERCVRAYARWLGAPERSGLRRKVRAVLAGKRLACHCAARGLPCHAEVLAVVANACVPSSMLCGLCD